MEFAVNIGRWNIRNQRNWLRHGLFLALGGMVFLMAGCEQKTIHHILLDPHRYANQEVAVVGKVVQSYSLMGHGAYAVDDGTGTLWVISQGGVPREGARVGVKGKIRDVVNLGELGSLLKLPESVRSGVVMMESERKTKD
jgi:hypothetical protein